MSAISELSNILSLHKSKQKEKHCKRFATREALVDVDLVLFMFVSLLVAVECQKIDCLFELEDL